MFKMETGWLRLGLLVFGKMHMHADVTAHTGSSIVPEAASPCQTCRCL